MRRLALRCVLSDKARQQQLICIDGIDGVDGKTKSMVNILANLGISGSALLVTRDPIAGVVRAAGNIKNVWTLTVNLLNADELLRRETLVMTLDALRWAEQELATDPHGRRGRAAGAPAEVESPADAPVPDAVSEVTSGEEAPAGQAEDAVAESSGDDLDEGGVA
jgi:hypothetical protein